MSIPIRFDLEAEQELEAAAIFYEQRRDGLGKTFLNAIDDAVGRLRDAPRRFRWAPNIPQELGVRRILLVKFPYSLAYLILEGEIRVLAVAHASRRPGYWAERLE